MRALASFLGALVLVACTGDHGGKKAGGAPGADPQANAVAALVLADLASNAFGNQKIARDCVAVSQPVTARNGASVVAAHVKREPRCGDIDFLWIFTRAPAAAEWNEGFLGGRPTCWKGTPDDIAAAVAEASGIAACQ